MIGWYDGHIEYDELRKVLLEAVAGHGDVYTKGSEKAKIFTELLGRPVYDLDKLECPRADQLPWPCHITCPFKHHRDCALNKALKYAGWINMKLQSLEHGF